MPSTPRAAPPISSTSSLLALAIRRRITPELNELARVGREDGDGLPAIEPLHRLVRRMRGTQDKHRALAVEAVCALLELDESLREGVREYVSRLVVAARLSSALADLGLLPAHGFVEELRRRMSERVLPSHRPPHDLTEILQSIFVPADAHWVAALDDATVTRLIGLFAPTGTRASNAVAAGTLRAIDLLAHRLAAAGEDPVLLDFDPEAHDFDSPYLAQANQGLAMTGAIRARLGLEGASPSDLDHDEGARHANVLLRQCSEATARVRRRTPQTGATIRLTYELERIDDLIARLSLLLDTFSTQADVRSEAAVALFRRLVTAQGEAEQVMPLLRRASYLVATEIVSHAGRTGEHYIARTRSEYGWMWLAAGGAGLVVACMAGIKVGLAAIDAPPLVEAALFSANYAGGFVLVQLLAMTIATKQPAMTAAALAGSIDSTRPNETRSLIETIQCLVRSQLAAILGNCLVALPAAILVSHVYLRTFGVHIASIAKAHHLVADVDLRGLAVPHAAVAGVWLTASGILAGYASSAVLARHVPDRIRRSAGLRRRIGEKGVQRLARFVETQAGSIAGSIVLGILLGSTGMMGEILGLPIDIRHVSFASANLGLAIATLGVGHVNLAYSLLGIALIGATNLTVSFSLSLGLALHARHARLRDMPTLTRDLLRSGLVELPSWILPVGASAAPHATEEHSG